MCSFTTLMSFFRILKLRTSRFYWTGTCTYSRLLLNISFITVHSSDSFTLSFFLSFFFLLVLPWQVTASDAGRPVFSFGRTLTLMCPLYAVQGCHLYVDNVSEPTILSSSSLSEPKVDVSSRSGVAFSMPDKILLAICTFYMPLALAFSP